MTELDKALDIFKQDMENPQNQSQFYDLLLNSTLYIPVYPKDEATGEESAASAETGAAPVVISADGNDYLMLFDTRERLNSWAQEEVPCIAVPGHVVASTSPEPLRWALNVGTEHSKEFLPEEIAWLKDAVARCQAEAGEGE